MNSENAKRVLATKKLGRRYETKFMASRPYLSINRRGNVSINRALNCTCEMAAQHIDELAQGHQETGIMKNACRERDGVWS